MATPVITPDILQRLKAVQDAGPAPLIPANPFAGGGMGLAAMSNIPAPVSPVVTPSQTMTDQSELNRVKATGSGVSQIQNPFLHALARTADVIGTIAVPRIAQAIPGTTLHHQQLLGQDQGLVNNDLSTDAQESAARDQQAQAVQRQAMADKASAQADAYTPTEVTPEMASAVGAPEIAGQRMTAQTYQKLLAGHQQNASKEAVGAGHDATRVTTTGMNNATALTTNQATNQSHEDIADSTNKTHVLIADLKDATSRANNANTNNHKAGGSAPGAGNFKVPADVTKRAALASNVNENISAVQDLIQAHPEMVGATGGRYSNVQQMIGSNDPNIQALGVRMHNIALASNGAHGVRAQMAIQKTEDELFNHFKAGPAAINAALGATKGSVQTFLDDEHNFSTTGSRVPTAPPNLSGDGAADFIYVPGKGLVKQ